MKSKTIIWKFKKV